MAFTAITFVAFTALVALISWWKTRGDNLDTQDGYYLGGRSLTGPVIAGSLLMTNLSANSSLATTVRQFASVCPPWAGR